MKSFLEEYGYAILGVIVVIVLIAMVTPLGKVIKSALANVVNNFSAKTQNKLDGALNDLNITELNND